MWWLITLIAVIGIVFWVHYAQPMSLPDRVSIALDIIRSCEFNPAEGFDSASQEDDDLACWIKSGNHCVMLFHIDEGNDVKEIIDFASDSFHPALIIHYLNSKPIRTDSGEIVDAKSRQAAVELLRHVRQFVDTRQGRQLLEYDGCHY